MTIKKLMLGKLLKNKLLQKLLNIPNMLILFLNKNEKIIVSYGKNQNHLNLKNKYLKDVFIDIYKELSIFIKKNEAKKTIYWNKKAYELRYEKLEDSSDFILYFSHSFEEKDLSLESTKIKENPLRKTDELQVAFDLAANGISILDSNGMFLYANDFFQKMMSYSMEELYEESCISLSSDEYKEKSKAAIIKVIHEGSIINFKKVCVTKYGLHINASMSLRYIKSQNEIIMITSDITDDIKYQVNLEKQIEIELEKHEKQCKLMSHQSRLASMGEMIEAIAHQWRQPLNALGLLVQSLRHISSFEQISQDTLNKLEQEMMSKIHYMSQTIDDFNDFFKSSKEKKYFNIFNSIHDSLGLIKAQLEANQIEVVINCQNEKIELLGFVNEFRQVIINIVHNAMIAITNTERKRGLIKIELLFTSSHTTINICDNGGGIKGKNLDKIFNPYYTTKENGTGIGLHMSKVIIEEHMQGILSVENYQNGSKFSIAFNHKE